jgi:hypothetical protein
MPRSEEREANPIHATAVTCARVSTSESGPPYPLDSEERSVRFAEMTLYIGATPTLHIHGKVGMAEAEEEEDIGLI